MVNRSNGLVRAVHSTRFGSSKGQRDNAHRVRDLHVLFPFWEDYESASLSSCILVWILVVYLGVVVFIGFWSSVVLHRMYYVFAL